ncbi:MAG: hypothetical protein DWQ04_24915 [Chloroflexi bacterium]|nr:MAG: hypothetical protein DWQ04_24915 [Chloroflexota bacterium]
MRRVAFWLGVSLVAALMIWWVSVGDVQQVTAVFLFWLLPIYTWELVIFGRVRCHLAWTKQCFALRFSGWLTAAGWVLLLHVIGGLLIHYLPGPVPRLLLLGWGVFVVVLPVFASFFLIRMGKKTDGEEKSSGTTSKGSESAISAKSLIPILLLILLAILLRLPNMGYKELQGDEGIILMRAATALTGDDVELFLHQKGPVEIVLPMVAWGSTGAISEFWARLPFLWGNVLAVLVMVALARRWFGDKVALVAGVLLAVNGFSIAFGRIIQYQSFVMLWGLLALLHADRYREDGDGWALGLTAVFLAGGLLSHYDAVLVAPAIVWLVWPRLQIARWWEWLLSGAIGFGLLTLFYVPYVLHPNFAKTQSYLLGDRLGQEQAGATVRWSGTEVWQMATFYNSLYYILGLILLVGVGLVVLWWQKNGRISALLTFLVPLLFYTVIVDDARTHVYTIFPGAAMLAAVGGVWLWQKVSQPVMQRLLVGLFVGFIVVSAVYVCLMFVDTSPERQRTWAENKPAFFPTTWDEPPLYGLFGFPYQAGWRAVGELPLALPYASNEEEEITNIYMGQANRTHCPDFETFIVANNVQDTVPYDAAWLDGMFLQHEVVVNGRSTMQIYGREETAVNSIDAHRTKHWLTPEEAAAPQPEGIVPVDAILGNGQVKLLGYDVNVENAVPGGQVAVTLFWEALLPFTEPHQVFTHLVAGGELVAQHDGAPECNMNPTTRWEPGQIIPDTHLIDIPPGMSLGPVTLLVGMYNLETLVRLPIQTGGDDTILLGEILIE